MRLAVVIVPVLLLASSPAQGIAEELEAAQREMHAGQWRAAAELLSRLGERVEIDEDRIRIAEMLDEVGNAVLAGGEPASAQAAFEKALLLRKRVVGERDDTGIGASLSRIARCLHLLRRGGEAVAMYEGALAMAQRMHGEHDHLDVAVAHGNLASCLDDLGRTDEALPHFEAAHAVQARLHDGRDHVQVADRLRKLAMCLEELDRHAEALARNEAALAMYQRLHDDRDDPAVAGALLGVGHSLQSMGRLREAFEHMQSSLAMQRRLDGDGDRVVLAATMHAIAFCLKDLARPEEALPIFEASLAMLRRLYGGREDVRIARNINNLALCLQDLGRIDEALPHFEEALAMERRLSGDGDSTSLAKGLRNVAYCLRPLGRVADALPLEETAYAMLRRLHGDRDHPDVALSLRGISGCLADLGRVEEAVSLDEEGLVMLRRWFGDHDHPLVAQALLRVGTCLLRMGKPEAAVERLEASLAMNRRLHEGRPHPSHADALNGIAGCFYKLGNLSEALPRFEASLGIWKAVHGDRDHGSIVTGLHNVASCLVRLERAAEALPRHEEALAMHLRLHSQRDHPQSILLLTELGSCLERLARTEEALACSRRAVDAAERIRGHSHLSDEFRQSMFDDLKRAGAFEQLWDLTAQLGHNAESLLAAERGRGRGLLDLLAQQTDPLVDAAREAGRRGDVVAQEELDTLRTDLAAADAEADRLLHQITRLDETEIDPAARAVRREALTQRASAVETRRRQLEDRRARLIGAAMPIGMARTAAEIQAALQPGELFLEYALAQRGCLLYVVARDSQVDVIRLSTAILTVYPSLPHLLRGISHDQLSEARGRDPDGGPAHGEVVVRQLRELFDVLIPDAVRPRIRSAKRVLVAAHGELHRLPFEALITDVRAGKPVYWLDEGPPIAYVPSGSALCWLRERSPGAPPVDGLDLVAVGDPTALSEPEVPEQGVLVTAVQPGGQADRLGLLPRDVLLAYAGKPLADHTVLAALRQESEAAFASRAHDDTPIPLEVWRAGRTLRLEIRSGPLGLRVAPAPPRDAWHGALGVDAELQHLARAGDLERVRRLPPLRGAAAEAAAIAMTWSAGDRTVKTLLGEEATESAVSGLAPRTRYLHFACHGIAEEYAGQSLSMLVLCQRPEVAPEDDGLLKLGDLLRNWRGRLSTCRLVVLSACRTNVGPLFRDEAPQALPVGFLVAGAPAVISSLWAVDDASTRELMSDFYTRLLTDEGDKLAAFTAARRTLRAKHPDPFHWAPFLFIGLPD